jgi:hypothetical protein
MYSLYKEEGTLYGYYKFLKIRWEGYSDYSYSWSSCSLIYDVILWDTGAISLHMIKIPSTYNTGTYALNSNSNVYRYSVNSSQKDVTFTPVPNYSSQYTTSNDIINLAKPFENRFLIRSNTNYYTIADNALSAVDVTDLTSDTFLTFGTIDIPNANFLFELPNPELLYWANNNLGSPKKGLIVTGTPSFPQAFYYKQRTLAGNTLITKTKVSNAKGNILFTISFDDGQTWNYYNGTNWV